MSVPRLPEVGIIIGTLETPQRILGLPGRPADVPLRDWLAELGAQGCRLRITPVTAFGGCYVECPGDGSCELRRQQHCPLAAD